MSPTARTLPLRVIPLPGESLESWLQALAHRHLAQWGDLLSALLQLPDRSEGPSPLVRFSHRLAVSVTDDEAASIADATGVPAADIHAMTLCHYAGRAIGIDRITGRYKPFPWGRVRGSRYCPQCLADTEGRWQLSWRLGWTFVCEKHQCLLLDRCPQCQQVQRFRPTPTALIPKLGTCTGAALPNDAHPRPSCTALLSDQRTRTLAHEHPAIHAQHRINDIIEQSIADFGVYRTSPQRGEAALTDIRSLARRILSEPEAPALNQLVPADIVSAHRAVRRSRTAARQPPGAQAPTDACTAAAGVIGALAILDCENVEVAADRLRLLMSGVRDHGTVIVAGTLTREPKTPVLRAIELSALSAGMGAARQLNYRVGASPFHASARAKDSLSQAAFARRLPTMLWPDWSLRFVPPHYSQKVARPALSAAVLITASRQRLSHALAALDSSQGEQAADVLLRSLSREPNWIDIRSAIIALHDHLVEHQPPIDYARRRKLSYRNLLTPQQWQRICETTRTTARDSRINTIRYYLYEQISGMPGSAAHQPWSNNGVARSARFFPRQLTPELAAALDQRARDFLTARHITDEPVTWSPDLALITGLALPGISALETDIAELHRLIREEDISINAAAECLDVPADYVRHLLSTSPAPATGRFWGRYRPSAQELLPRDELYRRYEVEHQSLSAIGDDVGYTAHTIATLLRHYGIRVHSRGGR